MKKVIYKLEKEYPILDWKTKKFVRNLKAEDLDGRLAMEIEHDNISEIWFDDRSRIVYTTKEGGGAFIVTPGMPGKSGFLGRFEIEPELLKEVQGNWEHYAAIIAVNLGTTYLDDLGVYYCVVGNTLWEIAEPNRADNSLTVFFGEKEKTFYFRRIWPEEREKRGLSVGDIV